MKMNLYYQVPFQYVSGLHVFQAKFAQVKFWGTERTDTHQSMNTEGTETSTETKDRRVSTGCRIETLKRKAESGDN